MRKFLIGFAAIAVVLIVAIAALPFLVPASTYRNVIESRLEESLGRDVTFGSDPQIRFFPQLGASFDDVTIANAEGFEAPHFAKAESLSVAVKWLPLLSRRVEIASANFQTCEVFLEEDRAGNTNWTFVPTSETNEPSTASATGTSEPGFDALIPKASLTNSRIRYTSAAQGLDYDITDINLDAGLNGFDGPVTLKGGLTLNDQPIRVDGTLTSLNNVINAEPFDVDATISSDMANVSFDGSIETSDVLGITGTFDADLSDVQRLLDFAGVDLEQDLSDIGRIKAAGEVSGSIEALRLTNLSVSQDGRGLSASYTGNISTGDTISFDGAFTADIDDVQKLARLGRLQSEDMDLGALGQVQGSGYVSGALENLKLTGVNFSQKSNLLESRYSGSVTLGDAIQPIGTVSLVSSNVKKLAETFGIALEGADRSAFKTLDAKIGLSAAGNGFKADLQTFRFDNIEADGTATLDLSGETPFISADLQIPDLDLSPYLTSSENSETPGDPTDGWSTEPIDLTVLKSANGEFALNIGRLANERAEILDVRFDGTLRNGTLSGELLTRAPEGGRSGSRSNLINPFYSGDLKTDFSVTSVSETANRLSFSANGSGIAASDLVKFFTGQNVLTGVASLDANANTNGASTADFVDNLSGTYNAEIGDGAILGINLPQLMRSAQEALTSGKLPAALSPQSETDFSSLSLQGDITSGTANIDVFRLVSPVLRAEASGTVDLYNQTLDIRLRPRALENVAGSNPLLGAAGFGIPLRVQGSWYSIKGSLDMDFLSTLIANEAKASLQKNLEDRIGKELGSILGTNSKSSSSDGTTTGTPDDSSTSDETSEPENAAEDTSAPEEEEQSAEDAAKELLKGLIFGKGN